MSRFGEFINTRCKELGITHGEFEIRADLSFGTTSKYINGNRAPMAVSLIKMMMALELSEDEILDVIDAIKMDAIERGEIIEQ